MSSWTEINPRVLMKELGGEEKVYRTISTTFEHLGKEQWSLYCVCSLQTGLAYTGKSLEVALREAWKALRFDFPGLSVIPAGLTKIYLRPDDQDIQNWVSETFFVETTSSADEVLENAGPRNLPSLHYFPSSSEILFQSSHWRIDAVGTCMLLNRLFSILAQPPIRDEFPWAEEMKNMSPSMEDAVGPEDTTAPAIDDFARSVIENFHKNTLQNCGLRYNGNKDTPPAGSSRQAVFYTKESTDVFVAACKKRNFSVTAAVHAALAEKIFSISPDLGSDYTSAISINLRPYLQQPYGTNAHACQTYVTSIAPRVLRNSSFAERAKELAKDYKEWHTDDYMKALRPIYKYHSEAILAAQSRPLSPSSTPPAGVFLSSLGVIEQYLVGYYGNSVNVDGFRFGVSMMTRQMLLYVWTFKGQLNLSVNYNEAYHDKQGARDLLNGIHSILETELGFRFDQQ